MLFSAPPRSVGEPAGSSLRGSAATKQSIVRRKTGLLRLVRDDEGGKMKKPRPRDAPGQVCRQYGLGGASSSPELDGLEAIQDLVGPEALEPVQRLVQRRELVGS